MKKIHVQKKLSLFHLILLLVFLLAFCLGIVYVLITQDYLSARTRGDAYAFFGFAIFVAALCIKEYTFSNEYVSEMIITHDSLILVYKYGNKSREEIINISDITSVTADLFSNNAHRGKYTIIECETEVTIKTKQNRTISFTEKPTNISFNCTYGFLLRLIAAASLLPNFSYTITGNADAVKEDVHHYELYGKRMTFWQFQKAQYKNSPKSTKIALWICLFLIVIPVGLMCYTLCPNFVSEKDKQYVTIIESGYSFYQQDLYDDSAREYDRALNIHNDDAVLYYYRALTYYYAKDYEKAKSEALKGLSFIKTKSAYYKAKNYKFLDNNKIGLYTTLADSEKKLKQYGDAKNTYSYIINNVKYKYTDAYFKRGQCEYYLGEKETAITDFYRHKEIIETYIADEEASEYKSKYPTYNQDDIRNINSWISAAMKL